MTAHTHPDTRLTFGCPACATEVAADQAAAELAAAPTRRCTWHCRYLNVNPDRTTDLATIVFTIAVKVPAGWNGDQVDTQYCAEAGERFALTLPDTLTNEAVSAACETMEVERVVIGDTLPDTLDAPPAVDVPLFDLHAGAA